MKAFGFGFVSCVLYRDRPDDGKESDKPGHDSSHKLKQAHEIQRNIRREHNLGSDEIKIAEER